MESQIWTDVKEQDVKMIGLDVFNGSRSQVKIFQGTTGATFPLLLKGALGQNFDSGNHFSRTMDDVVIIDQAGTVRLIVNFFEIGNIEDILDLVAQLQTETPRVELSLQHLYFGRTLSVLESKSLSLSIRNNTTTPLVIQKIHTDLPDLSFSPSTLTISSQSRKTIAITVLPKNQGTIRGKIWFEASERISALEIRPTTVEAPPKRLADPRTDANADGKVDFADFLSFSAAFKNNTLTFDFNNNGRVDFPDFLIFATSFGQDIE